MRYPRLFLFAVLFVPVLLEGQRPEPIYDEGEVPAIAPADPLRFADGAPVTTPGAWFTKRRPQLLQAFADHVYGNVPEADVRMRWDLRAAHPDALGGKAALLDILLTFVGNGRTRTADLLVWVPCDRKGPAPAFLGLNFYGNHTIHDDPRIPLHRSWSRNNAAFGITENRAAEASRGVRASRWPVELLIDRGYALATLYYGDFDPDFDDGFQNGLHPLFYREGQEAPTPLEWGSIGAWAWGLSRALDCLRALPAIDGRRVAVFGHSRLGKTSLWAGALDERFALVVSNNSGCGGAALSKRRIGERLVHINGNFPHWFNDVFPLYNERESQLPVDQHLLLACVAPRPLYVASATEDRWADPRGEFLSAVHAGAVYAFLGLPGLPTDDMPPADTPVTGTIGYHLRTGEHDVTESDWRAYLDFADRFLN